MKKFTSLFLLALLPLMASAYDAQVDGIYYNFDADTKQATVTSGYPRYTGNVVIPETFTYDGVTYSVTNIGVRAFYNCIELTSVTIPNSVTNIGVEAFVGCKGLTSVTIPNSVTEIGRDAFASCSGLTEVHITDIAAWCKIYFDGYISNPLYIAHHLFLNGNEVKDLVIPNSVTSIGDYAFYGCSELTSVTIPNSVTSIGKNVFGGCTGLTSVTIPNSVTSIGEVAFRDCRGLTSVTIGSGVTELRQWAFYGCTGKLTVNCDIPSSQLSSYSDGTLYTNGAFFGSKFSSVTIGDEVKSIGNFAFFDCSNLAEVTIPNSVTEIGPGAFDGTAWYENQPDGVVYAGKIAYKYKGEMPENTSINIKEGTLGITREAFYRCTGLTEVTIPNSVTSIGSGAFRDCSGLTEVYSYATSVPTTGSSVFYNVPQSNATLYVPSASIDAYKTTSPWSGFGTIKAIEDITGVKNVSAEGNGTADGKYLKDGKLVIIKGGKEYDAAGAVK